MPDPTKESEILLYASLGSSRLIASKELDRKQYEKLTTEMLALEKKLGMSHEEIVDSARVLALGE